MSEEQSEEKNIQAEQPVSENPAREEINAKELTERHRKRKTSEEIKKSAIEQNDSRANKQIKWFALGIGALLIVIVLGQVIIGVLATDPASTRIDAAQLGGSLAAVNNGVQQVSVSMQGYQYIPNPIRLKVGVPARMTVDLNTVRGCMRNIRIPELGVSARVSEGNNVIEFTPTKAGTFRMTCSMGMGQGIVLVEDQNGQVPTPSPNAALISPPAGGSCGAGGGGCGCGG